MNSVNLIGRLCADPEIYYGNDGTIVAKYTLAVNRNADNTDFIRTVCFGNCAEFAELHLQKGMKIGVTGRIQTGSYETKDGDTRYTTDVVVYSHTFCEPLSEGEGKKTFSGKSAKEARQAKNPRQAKRRNKEEEEEH